MQSLQRDPLYLELVHFYMIIYVHLYLSIYNGSPDHPYQMPYVEYGREINALEDAIYQFINEHLEYELNNYNDILKRNHIEWGLKIYG